ncbi:MAG TPA: citramalate synthase [Verrucomicrobiae bacterium]|nr:citramalate synthase [Verrucomicrobiae bacterium]
MTEPVVLYDTTLRDGMQGFGLQLSLDQKLGIARRLDRLGLAYVEGGWPGANPRDTALFQRLAAHPLETARLAAFGATCRPGAAAEVDEGLRATLAAQAPVVTLVGKASRWQAETVLGTTAAENLRMIADSCRHAVDQGHEVIFDAEHFFDGFDGLGAAPGDRGYALAALDAAAAGGAAWIVLCDTNGGQLPAAIAAGVAAARERVGDRVGIHCHNDAGVAVAASLAALAAGARMVQGTLNGCGERCGNTDLLVVAATCELKLGRPALPPGRLDELVQVSRAFDAALNRAPDAHRPYVGAAAFLHKGGLHAQGMARDPRAYQHVDPARVGNRSRTVVSDQSGRSNIAAKLRELGLTDLDRDARGRLVQQLKVLEAHGWAFEDADASFELLVRRAQPDDRPPFALREVLVVARQETLDEGGDRQSVETSVKLEVGGTRVHTAATGMGPVEALDIALRRALVPHFPELAQVQLMDYRVRVIDGDRGTGATVRVGIDSSDGVGLWTTVGCSGNILHASALALVDGYEWAVRHLGQGRLVASA